MSNGLQHKLYHLEVPPPAAVWEKIAEALDESDIDYNYPARLRELEIAVPPAAWGRIQTSLAVEQEAAIPEHRRLSPLVRYAAAAVITGLLGLGAWQLLKTKEAPQDTFAKEIKPTQPVNDTPSENNSSSPEENTGVASTAPETQDARDEAALEDSKRTYARLDVPTNSKLKNVADFYFALDEQPAPRTRGLDYGDPDMEEPEEDLASRYVLLLTPDGNIVRMSKKLGDQLVCCVSGQEQDEQCIDQMKKWKNKLNSSPATHSSGGFINILSLISSLQDNNYH